MLKETDRTNYYHEYRPVIIYKKPGKDIYVIRIEPMARVICFSYEFSNCFIISSWLLVFNN